MGKRIVSGYQNQLVIRDAKIAKRMKELTDAGTAKMVAYNTIMSEFNFFSVHGVVSALQRHAHRCQAKENNN